jgi:predicted NUDIX family phosphoesterase
MSIRKIWCVKNSRIPHLHTPSGFIRGVKAAEIASTLAQNGSWEPKTDELENDRNFRQVIPYVIITNYKTGLHLMVERLNKQDESRLHDKVSVGIGGHIEEIDMQFGPDHLLPQASYRELNEETGFSTGSGMFAGIIAVTDPEEPIVHHVHIGVVYHLFTSETDFKGEEDKQKRQWVTPAYLGSCVSRMETWSRIAWNSYLWEVS